MFRPRWEFQPRLLPAPAGPGAVIGLGARMRETRSRTNAGPSRFIGGAAIFANRTLPSSKTVNHGCGGAKPGAMHLIAQLLATSAIERSYDIAAPPGISMSPRSL